MTFDISTLALKDTFDMPLKHPVSGEPLLVNDDPEKPVTIKLYGTASRQYQAALDKMQTKHLRRNAKREKPTASDLKEEQISLLVACSAGTENFAIGKEAFAGDKQAFTTLYGDSQYSWIKDQVDEALGNPANFLPE